MSSLIPLGLQSISPKNRSEIGRREIRNKLLKRVSVPPYIVLSARATTTYSRECPSLTISSSRSIIPFRLFVRACQQKGYGDYPSLALPAPSGGLRRVRALFSRGLEVSWTVVGLRLAKQYFAAKNGACGREKGGVEKQERVGAFERSHGDERLSLVPMLCVGTNWLRRSASFEARASNMTRQQATWGTQSVLAVRSHGDRGNEGAYGRKSCTTVTSRI